MKIYTNNILVEQLRPHLESIKVKKDFTWHYLFVISHVYIKPYIDKRYTENDFIPINVLTLRSIVSKKETDNILKNLVYWGFLETDNTYRKGWKSKGFRLVDRNTGKWSLQLVKDKHLNDKLEKKKNEIKNMEGGYKIVNYWFNELKLDYKKSKKWIDNNLRTDQNKFESAVTSINLMKDNTTKFCIIDNTSNRMHNNLTSLHKPLRKFLTIDGEQLVECDIVNSQPVFLALVMKNRNIPEIEKYSNLVCSGEFYEYMASKLDINIKNDDDRKSFKQKIFSGVLFDRNRDTLSKYEEVFKQEFPTVFNEIREMKKDDYRSVAISLQKMESKFIFNVVDQIDRKIGRSKAPLLTIHDSILTTKKYKDVVKETMLECFEDFFKIKPKIK